MARRRINKSAVASSTGDYTFISHDRRAGQSPKRAKQPFAKCGGMLIAITAVQAATLAAEQVVWRL